MPVIGVVMPNTGSTVAFLSEHTPASPGLEGVPHLLGAGRSPLKQGRFLEAATPIRMTPDAHHRNPRFDSGIPAAFDVAIATKAGIGEQSIRLLTSFGQRLDLGPGARDGREPVFTTRSRWGQIRVFGAPLIASYRMHRHR